MIELGRIQTLPVLELGARGVWLGTDGHEVPLDDQDPSGDLSVGDAVEVFVPTDREGRPLATRQLPAGQVGEFVVLEVAGANEHGVFFGWGLPKDLFCPWILQHERLYVGERAVVRVEIHERTQRLVGHTKLMPFLDLHSDHLRAGQQVEALVFADHDLGALCIVDGRFHGLLYDQPWFERPHVGDTVPAWISTVREDGRLDLADRPPAHRADGGRPAPDPRAPRGVRRLPPPARQERSRRHPAARSA